MKTYLAKKEEVKRNWWLLNAEGRTLGRLASQIALLLRGKLKPEYTPNVDVGDFVIVINSDKIKLTGKKELKKIYRSHSGVPGGFKSVSVQELMSNHSEKVIENAVRGMLPQTTLGEKQFQKLNVYKKENHPHSSQKPKVWKELFSCKRRGI